jgi:hypothetical protein
MCEVPLWGAAKADRSSRVRRDIWRRERRRVKRFFPYMYGGMPGMMGGYGGGMSSASAVAMATGSYGSYGYPFYG